MALPKFSSSLCLLTFAILIQTISATKPLFHICSTAENFTTNSLYETNLKHLLSALYFKVPPHGFGLASIVPTSHDQNNRSSDHDGAYGLGLCRGDVSPADCKTCMAGASSQLTKRCDHNKGGIIWYDHCLLKYSDKHFFGQIDHANVFYMYNVKSVSDPEMFNMKTKGLLKRLAEEASGSKKMYAGGEAEIGGDGLGKKKVYGVAQCTRDVSGSDCKKCLDGAIEKLPGGGKEGGRVVGGTCNIGYEIYPFLSTHN